MNRQKKLLDAARAHIVSAQLHVRSMGLNIDLSKSLELALDMIQAARLEVKPELKLPQDSSGGALTTALFEACEALRYCRTEAQRLGKNPAAWAPAVIDRVDAFLREGVYARLDEHLPLQDAPGTPFELEDGGGGLNRPKDAPGLSCSLCQQLVTACFCPAGDLRTTAEKLRLVMEHLGLDGGC